MRNQAVRMNEGAIHSPGQYRRCSRASYRTLHGTKPNQNEAVIGKVGGCGDVQARPTQDMQVLGSIPARDPVRACLPRGPSTEAMLYAVPATLNKIGCVVQPGRTY